MKRSQFPQPVYRLLSYGTGGHRYYGLLKEPGDLTKAERLHVVSMLMKSRVFSMQKSVSYVAERLRVSRFTVYNYLNELKGKK